MTEVGTASEESGDIEVPGLNFSRLMKRHGLDPIRRGRVTTVQVNLGRLCNMACQHCHVEAGPTRTEIMTSETVDRLLDVLAADPEVEVLDLTGGAPELNSRFRHLVSRARRLDLRVIDRCNLTVLFEPGMDGLAGFLADEGVEVVASLPCHDAVNVERQRGKGAYSRSIEALKRLNDLGYGREGSPLKLDLVYNPVDATLPPSAVELEHRYKEELSRLFGIRFDRLITITNMPIKRFAHHLERTGQTLSYRTLLEQRFNPLAVDKVMCRSLVSVGWDGLLYDCDFNQMLDMATSGGERSIWEVENFQDLAGAEVRVADHCLGCTAGAGSGCSGALV